MTIADALKDVLEKHPGLDLVAFGDLSTGVILNSASRASLRREVLDLMAERAAAGFALIDAAALPAGVNIEAHGTSVIHFTEDRSEIFARNPAAPEDVVGAVCRPQAPLLANLKASLGLAYRLTDTT